MKVYKPLIFLFIFLLSSKLSKAQEATWELGGTIGAAGYMGDLNQYNPIQLSGISASVFAKRNFNGLFGVRFNYNYGQIKADDAKSDYQQNRNRNINFKTNLNELGALLDFNLFEFTAGAGGKKFTPYLFTGAAAVFFNPSATYNDTKYQLNGFRTEGQDKAYKKFALSIPYGIGIKYNYRDAWSLFSEIGYRTAFTDYLDDVSGEYPTSSSVALTGSIPVNLSDPSLNQIGLAGTQRGDFRKRDTYLFVSVGISFTFVNSKCYSL